MFMFNDQIKFESKMELSSPVPKPKSPRPSPNPVKPRSQSVPRGLGLTLKSYGPPTHHPQLLSMKEASNKKTQRVKVTQDDPLYLFSQKIRWTARGRT